MNIQLKEDYCVGCGLCQVYCVVFHSKSKDVIKAYKKEIPRVRPRVLLETQRPLSFPLRCQHCREAPCIQSCIAGALYKDHRGATLLDEEKCVSCYTCVMACPFGAIQVQGEEGQGRPHKCDLCRDMGEPGCVLHCPNGALVLQEVNNGE